MKKTFYTYIFKNVKTNERRCYRGVNSSMIFAKKSVKINPKEAYDWKLVSSN